MLSYCVFLRFSEVSILFVMCSVATCNYPRKFWWGCTCDNWCTNQTDSQKSAVFMATFRGAAERNSLSLWCISRKQRNTYMEHGTTFSNHRETAQMPLRLLDEDENSYSLRSLWIIGTWFYLWGTFRTPQAWEEVQGLQQSSCVSALEYWANFFIFFFHSLGKNTYFMTLYGLLSSLTLFLKFPLHFLL